MNSAHERLTSLLLEKNHSLTYEQARTWIELLWDDFETTQARAGRSYKGSDVTERIVEQWIGNYGPKLHEFIVKNPKYKEFLNPDQKNVH